MFSKYIWILEISINLSDSDPFLWLALSPQISKGNLSLWFYLVIS